VSLGLPMRSMVRPSSSADSSRRVAEFLAAHFDTLAAAAEGGDALVTTGFTHFAARSAGDRQTGHPLRVRDLLSDQSAGD
jgi:vancomycin aglycone glucosyltransferase